MKKKRPKTAETVANNIAMLIELWPMDIAEVARRSGVTKRMIQYIISGERVPSIEIADAIAGAFGLTGWQLLMPNLDVNLAKSGRLARLYENYQRAPEHTKAYIDGIAEHDAEAGYNNDKIA